MSPSLVRAALVAALVFTTGVPFESQAQSLLQRSPNLSGAWVGPPGQLQFNTVHRLRVSSGPVRNVTVSPTLLLAGRLPGGVLAGVNYGSNSPVSPRTPNEFEILARALFLRQGEGAPLDLGVQAGYNTAGRSADGELSAAREVGRVRLLTAARFFSSPYGGDDARSALAVGAVVRLGARSALAADVGGLLDMERDDGERIAWSVGLHFMIPFSPHTISFQASNAPTTTLEGSSRGVSSPRYGFEFTVPLTLSRIFGANAIPTRGGVPGARFPADRRSGAGDAIGGG